MGNRGCSHGEEVTVLEDMVKEGFSEMLMFRQSAKKN